MTNAEAERQLRVEFDGLRDVFDEFLLGEGWLDKEYRLVAATAIPRSTS